jgi:hypothetical protein
MNLKHLTTAVRQPRAAIGIFRSITDTEGIKDRIRFTMRLRSESPTFLKKAFLQQKHWDFDLWGQHSCNLKDQALKFFKLQQIKGYQRRIQSVR